MRVHSYRDDENEKERGEMNCETNEKKQVTQ